jgi:hypothetical protein
VVVGATVPGVQRIGKIGYSHPDRGVPSKAEGAGQLVRNVVELGDGLLHPPAGIGHTYQSLLMTLDTDLALTPARSATWRIVLICSTSRRDDTSAPAGCHR